MEQRPSVDDLRARLRDLGYLDAGVDRFVLGQVRGGQGLFVIAFRSSIRIGLLAALLLGPSAAIAVGARVPGLVTTARDGVVLALYLAGLSGVAVFGLALVATLLLGVLAARPAGDAIQRGALRLARAAGAAVTMSSLCYLVLWWRTLSPSGSDWHRSGWTWLVLLLATAVSMLLGHAVMVTTLAMAARGATRLSPSLSLRGRSWRMTFLLAASVFVAAALTLFVASRGERTPPGPARPPAHPRVVPAARLTVIAIDGLDLPFVERIASSGKVRVLARLLAGARLEFPPSDAPDPARTWTSLATGQGADVHGVSGIESRTVSGMEGTVPTGHSALSDTLAAATDLVRLTRPTLTTSLQRRSKTIWEVASDYGLQSAVVNWWATWPAPESAGIILTDRATLRLERGGELDAEIAPPSLYHELRATWPGIRDAARHAIVDSFSGDAGGDAAILRRAAEQDAIPVALGERVFERAADLRALYLPGLDIAQYALLGSGGGSGLPASALAARLESLQRYYEYLDRLLARFVESRGGDEVLALLADPGRAATRGPGVLVLVGGAAAAGRRLAGSSADVAPTLLYLLGAPLSEELPGRIQADLLQPAFRDSHPVARVPSYGRRVVSPRPPAASPLDRDMLERLRSLGYLR